MIEDVYRKHLRSTMMPCNNNIENCRRNYPGSQKNAARNTNKGRSLVDAAPLPTRGVTYETRFY